MKSFVSSKLILAFIAVGFLDDPDAIASAQVAEECTTLLKYAYDSGYTTSATAIVSNSADDTTPWIQL